MNYCKYLKKRKNKPYCKLLDKEITFSCCRECDNKEYKKCTKFDKNSANVEKKYPKNTKTVQKYIIKQKNIKIRSKSSKLAKLERNRYSVFTENKDKCMFCSATTNLTWHEIYQGRNRKHSMEFGFCLRMCLTCHEKYQDNIIFNEMWHKLAQKYFEDDIASRNEFIKIFRRNYLK